MFPCVCVDAQARSDKLDFDWTLNWAIFTQRFDKFAGWLSWLASCLINCCIIRRKVSISIGAMSRGGGGGGGVNGDASGR